MVFSDPSVRKKRKSSGGSGRKTFTEGWVEFKVKKVAKNVAISLNNTLIGMKIVEFIQLVEHFDVEEFFNFYLFRWKEKELLP